MTAFKDVRVPERGEPVQVDRGRWIVPARPIVPYIEGDGIGVDIWPATRRVLDAAVRHAYGDDRNIAWMEVYAGEKAHARFGVWLPEETLEALRAFHVGIKGPLTTPVGGGIRSLNVTLRQVLDLYACIRPVRWIRGVPSPVRRPERLDVVLFRENTEDVYAGLEFAAGSPEANRLRGFLKEELGVQVREGSAIGIKPMSAFGTKRLVTKAIEYALEFPHPSPSVTLVHKGNIMKYTEGAFRDWGYEVARERFGDRTVEEQDVAERFGGEVPEGRVVMKDRIADSMFQQVLLRPDEYWVIALPNLNGDYLSDACAAQVGGLGMAPGANVGDDVAVFEATHGTAPKHAGQDKANPGSLILSGVMLLRHLGWTEAADAVVRALERTISGKTVTYDLERQMEGARKVGTSAFAGAIIEALA